MRHSYRQKHRKQLNRSTHIRRMCYFNTVQYLKPAKNRTANVQAEAETTQSTQKKP